LGELTAIEVRNAPPGRYNDGNGLYLLVRSCSSKSWVLRTQVKGRRQDFGLGSARSISLAQARAAAAEMRRQVKRGDEAHPEVVIEAPAVPAVPTFAEAPAACHQAMKEGWRNKRHRDTWIASLENHIHPSLGPVPVDAVTPMMVRDAIAPIWLTIPETARFTTRCFGENSLRSVKGRLLAHHPNSDSERRRS
jgi:hypothetical protein